MDGDGLEERRGGMRVRVEGEHKVKKKIKYKKEKKKRKCTTYWAPTKNLRIAILSGFIAIVCDSISNNVCCLFLH